MKTYILKRLIQSVLVLLGVTFIVFVILHLTGDPTYFLLPPEATRETIENFRRQMGFDRPLSLQYLTFLKGLLHGDFGNSLRHEESALALVLNSLPATMELTAAAMVFALIVAFPIGIFSALKPKALADHAGMVLILLGQATPIYWSGLMLIFLFTVKMGILPAYGRSGFLSLIMPALSLGFFSMARIARVSRSSMISVMSKDYMRTAKVKGLSDFQVMVRHGFKNAAMPIVTMIGIELARLLGGAVITETIFSWPGVGRMAVQAIYNRDFPVVQATVFVVATIILVINLTIDILYAYLDPRVRYD